MSEWVNAFPHLSSNIYALQREGLFTFHFAFGESRFTFSFYLFIFLFFLIPYPLYLVPLQRLIPYTLYPWVTAFDRRVLSQAALDRAILSCCISLGIPRILVSKSALMPIITIPKALREKLGEDGADALVDLFNQSDQRQKEDVLEFVEEKFERRLNEELSTLRIETNKRFAELEVTIEVTKSYMVRWMFAFWVAQVGVILGILFAFFK